MRSPFSGGSSPSTFSGAPGRRRVSRLDRRLASGPPLIRKRDGLLAGSCRHPLRRLHEEALGIYGEAHPDLAVRVALAHDAERPADAFGPDRPVADLHGYLDHLLLLHRLFSFL